MSIVYTIPMRKLSYDKLWQLLAAKDMKKKDLRLKAGLSSVSVAKLGKGESVGTGILLRICDALDCELCDILDTFEKSGEEYIGDYSQTNLSIANPSRMSYFLDAATLLVQLNSDVTAKAQEVAA